MTAVESLSWLAPAPIWGDGGLGTESAQLTTPWIVELKSDHFVDDFQSIMAGSAPDQIFQMEPDKKDGPAFRLFQPISQRYYLVTASLVCRRVGIPDRAVRPAKGERTTFVIRRIGSTGAEQALVNGAWVDVDANTLAPGEKQMPMHPVPVSGFAPFGSTADTFGMSVTGGRTVFYGYVPTGLREQTVPPISQPVDSLKQLLGGDLSTLRQDTVLADLVARVIRPWKALIDASKVSPGSLNTDYSSLYLILDLGDWLRTNLPTVYQHLVNGSALSGSALQKLADAIKKVKVSTGAAPADQPPATPPALGGSCSLDQALQQLKDFESLVAGGAGLPPNAYDLTNPTYTGGTIAELLDDSSQTGSLAMLALQALDYVQAAPAVPLELNGLIKADPIVTVPGQAPTYFIRTVFEHDPCQPVLSAPSASFQLARAIDPDAPARQVRIQMPDITNLRAFSRGVAIEMPPSLRRVTDRITTDTVNGKLGKDPGPELGMICSFSFQIFFVLSFMVAFVFLIVLNFVFWWMAFIKICFPIPVPRSKPGNPAP
jgi:hypothetical protein